MIDKIISYVITNISKKQVYTKIGYHCFSFLKNRITSVLSMKFISYDQCNCEQEKIIFFDNQLKNSDTWVEINEPSSSVTERAAHTLIKIKKATDEMENKILEVEGGKAVQSEITRSDDQIISMNVINNSKRKSSSVNNKKLLKKVDDAPKEEKDNKKIPLVEFPCYDIPIEKFKKRDEPEENAKLRKDILIEFQKRDEEKKREMEREQRRRRLLFESRIKKEIDFNKYTFTPGGEIIPVKHFNIESIGLGSEFYWSRALIKDGPVRPLPNNRTNIQQLNNNNTDSKSTEEIIRNNGTSTEDFESKDNYYDKKNLKKKGNPNSIYSSGSNFDLIQPEVGVAIHEEDKSKGGNKDFVKKYNKTSIYDYSKLLGESIKINESMVKRGVISQIPKDGFGLESLDNSIEEQPYYGYKDKILSSMNPLFENATKQLSLPIISVSSSDIPVKPTMISTQNNPLLARSNKTCIYKGGSEEDRIIIKNNNSVKDLQKALELEDNSYNNENKSTNLTNINILRQYKSMKRNKSDFGDAFQEEFRKKYQEKKSQDYSIVNKFNSSLVKNDGYSYVFNSVQKKICPHRNFSRGNKAKELGQSIISRKMPRERKFHQNQYQNEYNNEVKYSNLYRHRSGSVKHF